MLSLPLEIEKRLKEAFSPDVLKIEDDSARHAGHLHHKTSGGSHMTVFMVSSSFQGKTLLQRHRALQSVLKEFLKVDIHALSLKLLTPDEYANRRP